MKFLLALRFEILFLNLIVNTLANEISNDDWNYGKLGPDVWGKHFPNCNGHSQSPVNIQTACTEQQSFESFQFSSIFYENIIFTLENNGHTIKGEHNGSIIFTLTGGNLNGTYKFINFHLHWGPNENVGSEHQV